ncbi:MAG: ribonuclease J [Polyangiaceae bacterium]|nr:ribonuclease J [Polyangiaceae bacterium]
MRVVPLGGLGEIGMNCLALEVGDDILVVDCGVSFPRSDLGVDTYHPDLRWLEARRSRVRGLVLTHGHEDHIGAVPYFAGRFDVPVWGPRYALELVRRRLEEHDFRKGEVDLRESSPRRRFEVGGFEVEPVRVAHSIADATALAIRTRAGTVVHTGDFKLDDDADADERTDEARLAELGDEGVRLLLSDSTNIDSHGRSASERTAASALRTAVEGAKGRVVVGLFSSNLARLRALGEIARATGRRLGLFGRSVATHARIARELGLLDWPSDLVASEDDVGRLPRAAVLALAGGTQAEAPAALSRLARREHPRLSLDAGDRVILSARVIPGHEPAVAEMLGGFLRQGVEVRDHRSDPGVHVSGHAQRDEQARMIELVRPRGFVPVHGTVPHLYGHAALARDLGVEEVLVLENGEIGALDDEVALDKSTDRAQAGKVATWMGDEVAPGVLLDRQGIARSGVVFVTVTVDSQGRPLARPTLSTRGVIDEAEEPELLAEVAQEIEQRVATAGRGRGRATDDDVIEAARTAARRAFDHAVGRRPITSVHVVRAR